MHRSRPPQSSGSPGVFRRPDVTDGSGLCFARASEHNNFFGCRFRIAIRFRADFKLTRPVTRFTLKEEFLGMKELEQILRLWKEAEQSGESAVLATVVKTHGSSYRLPGARLLLTPNGQRAGSVSGGCLEDDLIKKAYWLTERGPVIRKYDTTPDGEIASGFGLGCSGVIDVLLSD